MSSNPTDLIHHPYQPPAGFAAPQPGVFKASTVIFPNVAAMRARDWTQKAGYTYGLHGTPTTFTLEERIATLEGGDQCVLAPSGLSAIATVDLALLHTGHELLLPANVYGPSKVLAEGELKNWGITFQQYDPMDPADLRARIGTRTRLVWLEVPGSVTMEFGPLRELAQVCRDRGVTTALDNTWGAGLAFNGFDAGCDIVVQALTKYPSGGGDVLMGSIVTRGNPDLHLKIKLAQMRIGTGVGANDAEQVLRSLPSMDLRYRAQDRSARELATWLKGRPEIAAVLHPALEGSPGHENWRALCGETDLAAGLFSVVLHERYAADQVDAFCDSLRLFKIGFSWGGPMSLVAPYDCASMRKKWPHKGVLVRFSLGLESVRDLVADIEQGFAALR
jgi:cysteine-S-conjugate beta-lyase